mgnify:CR=1 FL=1
MGNVKKKQRPNIDHIAHQVNVSGVGAHKSKKVYDRKKDKKDYKTVDKE